MSVSQVGREIVSPATWRRKNGKELDITFASPGYIKRVIEEDWQGVMYREAEEWMQVGGLDPWFVNKVSRKAHGLARVRWCQLLAGHLPTWEWIREHAKEVAPQSEYCPCGHNDNIDHRIQGCFVWNNGQEEVAKNRECNQVPLCHADVV